MRGHRIPAPAASSPSSRTHSARDAVGDSSAVGMNRCRSPLRDARHRSVHHRCGIVTRLLERLRQHEARHAVTHHCDTWASTAARHDASRRTPHRTSGTFARRSHPVAERSRSTRQCAVPASATLLYLDCMSSLEEGRAAHAVTKLRHAKRLECQTCCRYVCHGSSAVGVGCYVGSLGVFWVLICSGRVGGASAVLTALRPERVMERVTRVTAPRHGARHRRLLPAAHRGCQRKGRSPLFGDDRPTEGIVRRFARVTRSAPVRHARQSRCE